MIEFITRRFRRRASTRMCGSLARARAEDDGLEGGHLVEERFAVEIAGNEDVEAIIDAIFTELTGWSGDVSGKDIQLVDIEDADDDYVFRSIGEGEPTFLHALQVVVYWV